jgi:hypothetical protein
MLEDINLLTFSSFINNPKFLENQTDVPESLTASPKDLPSITPFVTSRPNPNPSPAL